MAGGLLNDRIAIQRLAPGSTPGGNAVVGWVDLELTPGTPLVLWADMNESPGGEDLVSGRLEAARQATIRICAGAVGREIRASDRIVARGAVWKIRSTPSQSPDRADVQVVLCEEWVNPPGYGD
ncbi:MAG TPA: hypothetical protein DEB47_12070 [Citreicella sp.]|nr:hypothetical protein [Citreicella sp.]